MTSAARTSRASSAMRPIAGTSSGSTWRTRAAPTTRCGSTASCARRATTTSASSSRRTCGGRPPPAHLRAVRAALVRVLAAPPAGEPEDRRVHRSRRARPRHSLPQQRAVIWTRAEGCRVWDETGRELLDLTAGFGVALLGHRNPRILEAWAAQPVVHALGDLAEAEVTAEPRRRLASPAKLGVTGEDAVEIALRTALLATGRAGIVAFDDAYHGTGLLALAATGLERFRTPFAPWLPGPA